MLQALDEMRLNALLAAAAKIIAPAADSLRIYRLHGEREGRGAHHRPRHMDRLRRRARHLTREPLAPVRIAPFRAPHKRLDSPMDPCRAAARRQIRDGGATTFAKCFPFCRIVQLLTVAVCSLGPPGGVRIETRN
jgi:CRISPR/Cas system-associated endoribonuclease Cas2